jgi:hypothetical protein
MTAKTGAKPEQNVTKTERSDDRRVDLGVRYGAIGISAVAAAVRYAGDTKNHAYAPVDHHIEERFTEVAAA